MTQFALRNDMEMPFGEILDPSQLAPHGSAAGAGAIRPAVHRLAFLWGVPIAAVVLFAGDAGTFAAAAALLAPFGSLAGQTPAVLSLVAASALLLYHASGLYPGYGVYPHELLRRRVAAMARIAPVAVAGAVLLSEGWTLPALLLTFLAIALALQPAVRAILRKALAAGGRWGTAVALVGDTAEVEVLKKYLAANWQIGMRCQDGPPREADVSVALLAGFRPQGDRLDGIRRRFAQVIAVGGIPGLCASGLGPTDFCGEIGLRLQRSAGAGSGRAARALDLAAAGLGLLVSAPVLLLAAGAVYAADPGPVLYRQTREGLDGRPFRMLKLRTMYRDADQRLEALLQADETVRAEWQTHYKLRNDPRILPVIGKFLRASSIDELPQLFNILRGDMRIVGPRPFPLYHLDAMDPAFRVKRCTVRPGLTGLWQISGRSTADIARQQELDGFYIDNRSFWLDLHILFGTVAAVFRGEGAY